MAIGTGTKAEIKLSAYDDRTIGLDSVRTPLVRADWTLSFSDGTGANQFQKVYATTRTLSGSSEDLDLSGSLADAFGATISATAVKLWALKNTSASNTLTFSTTGTNNWTGALNGSFTLPPGGVFLMAAPTAAGWTVTAGTADLLHVAGAASDTYQVIFWVEG